MHRQHRGRRLETRVDNGTVSCSHMKGLDDIIRKNSHSLRTRPPRNFCLPKFSFRFRSTQARSSHCMSPSPATLTCASQQVGYSARNGYAPLRNLISLDASVPEIQSSNSRFNDWVRRSFADVRMMTIGNPEVRLSLRRCSMVQHSIWARWDYYCTGNVVAESPDCKGSSAISGGNPGDGNQSCHGSANPARFCMRCGAEKWQISARSPSGVTTARWMRRRSSSCLRALITSARETSNSCESCGRTLNWLCDWIDEFGDVDGDGFVEYARHSSNGLVQQGWKDSNDSVFHADGTLAKAPIALCEVQGYVYAAKIAASRLNCALGNKNDARAFWQRRNSFRRNLKMLSGARIYPPTRWRWMARKNLAEFALPMQVIACIPALLH